MPNGLLRKSWQDKPDWGLYLDIRQPETLDEIGRPHEGAVRPPVGRGVIDDQAALVPRQVEVELEGHRQLDVVDPADLEHPDVDVDVERALGVRDDVLVVVVGKAERAMGEVWVPAVTPGDVAVDDVDDDERGGDKEQDNHVFERSSLVRSMHGEVQETLQLIHLSQFFCYDFRCDISVLAERTKKFFLPSLKKNCFQAFS